MTLGFLSGSRNFCKLLWVSCEVLFSHGYAWIHWVARSCTTTANRWLFRDSLPSLRTLWSAVLKLPNLSARGTASPVRLLQGALVILVRLQISHVLREVSINTVFARVPISCLSLFHCLSLSLDSVWCVWECMWCLWCGLRCEAVVVVVVSVVWPDEKPPCVRPKRPRVYIQKLSPCMPAPRAHVETHVQVVPVHTETFWMDTRRRFESTHGGRHSTTTTHTHTPQHTIHRPTISLRTTPWWSNRMFFHKPSMTSTGLGRWSNSECAGLTIVLARERRKCWPITWLSLSPRKLSVQFISFPKKFRETCRVVLTQQRVGSRNIFRWRSHFLRTSNGSRKRWNIR